MTNSISVYFVKTELESLAAEMIAEQEGSDGANLLMHSGAARPYFMNPDIFSCISSFSQENTKGILKEKRSIYKSLQHLEDHIRKINSNPEIIYIHLPRLSTSKTNYAINFLISSFPCSTVQVRLIPHGVATTNLININLSKRLKLIRRKFSPSRIFIPKIKYYPPSHDLVGGLDDIVDRVYTFQGITTPYPQEKVVEPTGLREPLRNTQKTSIGRTAVIIGQPLLDNNLITEQNHTIITQRIKSWLKDNNFQTIYYSEHPRSKGQRDFFQEDYKILNQEGAIEIALCEIQPDVVISCFSTALVTAKVLFGDQIQALSFGLADSLSEQKDSLSALFKRLNIELL